MNFLNRLWPFRGGDVATAVTDEDFVSVPRRPFRPSAILTAPSLPFAPIPRPIPLTEREPGPDDMDAIDYDCCYWGDWQEDHWIWKWGSGPWRDETHWLPASVQVLPARCCPPEVRP
jgi:hypothetical protein